MKKLMPVMLVAAGLVLAGPATSKPAATSPLLGNWSLDLARLPMPPEARPKSVTIAYSDAGAGKWRMAVDIVGGDGSASHAVSTWTPDGSTAPATGSETDSIAVKMPAPNVMVAALAKGGMPASTRIYTVAPDGKSMTETAVYFGQDGKAILRTAVFNRVK